MPHHARLQPAAYITWCSWKLLHCLSSNVITECPTWPQKCSYTYYNYTKNLYRHQTLPLAVSVCFVKSFVHPSHKVFSRAVFMINYKSTRATCLTENETELHTCELSGTALLLRTKWMVLKQNKIYKQIYKQCLGTSTLYRASNIKQLDSTKLRQHHQLQQSLLKQLLNTHSWKIVSHYSFGLFCIQNPTVTG